MLIPSFFRPIALGFCLAILCVSPSVLAKSLSEPDPALQVDWELRLEKARAQQREGQAKKAAAQEIFEAEKVVCFKKFRVTDCQEDAQRRFLLETNAARRIENEGLAAERLVKKEQLDDKDARYLAEAPQRAAELAEREARITEERQKAENKRAQTLVNKQKRATEGAERRTKEDERLKEKQSRHEKKVVEQQEKAKKQAEVDKPKDLPRPAL